MELFSGNGRKPRFPRAGWVSTEAKKDPGGYGHPEATLKPPSGQLVANR
jgi:hypothetical protein